MSKRSAKSRAALCGERNGSRSAERLRQAREHHKVGVNSARRVGAHNDRVRIASAQDQSPGDQVVKTASITSAGHHPEPDAK
jgi:hypothetical protein